MTTATLKLKAGSDIGNLEATGGTPVKKVKEKAKAPELKRMTIALPPETARLLELLSDLQGVTQTEALRRAIATEAFIQREIKAGSRILVQSPENQLKELVFR